MPRSPILACTFLAVATALGAVPGALAQPESCGLNETAHIPSGTIGAVTPVTPNVAAVAEGFGVKGRRVHKKSELRSAIQEMLDCDGPFVLDVIVPYTEHVLPMIPAGRSVKEMLLK